MRSSRKHYLVGLILQGKNIRHLDVSTRSQPEGLVGQATALLWAPIAPEVRFHIQSERGARSQSVFIEKLFAQKARILILQINPPTPGRPDKRTNACLEDPSQRVSQSRSRGIEVI